MKLLRIHPSDNVAVDTETGHKTALCNIAEGEAVIKYGFPIGHATKPVQKGERVHTDNLRTSLAGKLSYRYEPSEWAVSNSSRPVPMIRAYHRENGEIGVRNDIFIINTVGCVNRVAERIAELTGAYAFPHPYGCSQLGDDHMVTQKILRGLVMHPNAGGVLVLGLGCENNNIEAFRKILGPIDGRRIRFLNAQDCEDEITEGVRLVRELQGYAAADERTLAPLSQLKIGLKCGGSDGPSGITANPLIGRFTDLFTDMGGSAVLTEVPEMFGAETILMNRCLDETVFEKTVSLINGFKDYFTAHGQEIYENPSPGNKAGGITTLEEKSLGCIEKGGNAPVTDVLTYGERVTKSGLTLLDGPGNDIVAVTNLAAAGCHLILFSTGRGTPLGAPVPTVKIATNSALAERKIGWIDFDAGPVLNGEDLSEQLLRYVIRVAEGEQTANERNGCREIAIFKDGVTL